MLARSVLLLALCLGCIFSATSWAQDKSVPSPEDRAANKGQATLDQAFDLRPEAKTLDDLRKVLELCDKAVSLGLDDENTKLAKQQIAATAFERANEMIKSLGRSRMNAAGLKRLQTEMQKDLKAATEAEPKMAEAWLLRARVEERDEALQSIQKAIDLYASNPNERSKAYVVKAGLLENVDARIEALKQAIQDDNSNQAAWELSIQLQQLGKNHDAALQDAMKLLERDPSNMFGIAAAVDSLVHLERADDAIGLLTDKISLKPEDVALIRQRGELYANQDKFELALADMDKAVELNPRDVQSLLVRARTLLANTQYEKAEQDIEDALLIQPDNVLAIYLRSGIAAEQKRMNDAIRDMQRLVRAVPDNPEFLLSLASYFQVDDRPKKAIQVLTTIIDSDRSDWAVAKSRALRTRGDALLSIGDHLEAVKDYEKAIDLTDSKDEKTMSGILNNLAWVLATSPNDSVRDGERSLKLAKQACELTDYQEAHILSTLASAYAEVGSFDEAIQWSEKAVAAGKESKNEQLEQLEKELENYKQRKPWREIQDTSEKKSPVPATGGVDT